MPVMFRGGRGEEEEEERGEGEGEAGARLMLWLVLVQALMHRIRCTGGCLGRRRSCC